MQYVLAVFGFGALLLLVGLIGGDLKYGGATIPKVGAMPRFTTTIFGSGVLLLSLILFAVEEAATAQSSVASSGSQVNDSDTATNASSGTSAEASRTSSTSARRTVLVHFDAALVSGTDVAVVVIQIDGGQSKEVTLDKASPEQDFPFYLAPGTHQYSVAVAWSDGAGDQYVDKGSDTFTAAEGRTYEVDTDGLGNARLVAT
jgi:hypothetical protein